MSIPCLVSHLVLIRSSSVVSSSHRFLLRDASLFLVDHFYAHASHTITVTQSSQLALNLHLSLGLPYALGLQIILGLHAAPVCACAHAPAPTGASPKPRADRTVAEAAYPCIRSSAQTPYTSITCVFFCVLERRGGNISRRPLLFWSALGERGLSRQPLDANGGAFPEHS